MASIQLKERCHWFRIDHPLIGATPLAADLDGDGEAEILFSTYTDLAFTSDLVAIRSRDCSTVWTRRFVRDGSAPIAVADLDGDGKPEILLVEGALANLTILDGAGLVIASAPFTPWGRPGVTVANADGQGPPEILVGSTVFRYEAGTKTLDLLFDVERPITAGQYDVSVFADMDGDGKAEVVTGLTVLDGLSGVDKTPSRLRLVGPAGAYPAIGDFNGDRRADIALVQSGSGQHSVAVFDYVNNAFLLGPYPVSRLPGDDRWSGGPPLVDDTDGDAVPDVGVAGWSSYCVYAMKCNPPSPAAECGGGAGTLWCKRTQDFSSGITGATSFDFDGDGRKEIVYRDECWLRIYDGVTGKTLFSQAMTSGTAAEYPIVGDFDGDGHAELVVTSDSSIAYTCDGKPEAETQTPWGGPTEGVFIFEDAMDGWPSTRQVWTSHAYHVTDINDDLTVPTREMPSWRAHNTYRRNLAKGAPATWRKPDFTAGATSFVDNGGVDCAQSFRLFANVCNRGSWRALAGIPGAFYLSDPRPGGASPICTATTKGNLDPGQCESVHCDGPALTGTADLWFRADDDGRVAPIVDECRITNDVLFMPQVRCQSVR